MAIMVITRLTMIFYSSVKVCYNELFNVTAAATNHLNSLSFQNILGTLSHISCQHDHNAHLSENWSNSALASTPLRRSHLADIGHLSINNIKYRVICTMTEMVIHTSIPCWYCNLHNIILLY